MILNTDAVQSSTWELEFGGLYHPGEWAGDQYFWAAFLSLYSMHDFLRRRALFFVKRGGIHGTLLCLLCLTIVQVHGGRITRNRSMLAKVDFAILLRCIYAGGFFVSPDENHL